MLNGSKTTNVRYEMVPNGTRTITETMTSGYLDRDQLAFVYRLVCAMRNIPKAEYIQDLNSEAVQAIQTCDASFGHHYDTRFHRPETTYESVSRFHDAIVALQRDMAELDKNLAYIRQSCCETLDGFLTQGHQQLESLRQKTAAITEKTGFDPALNFLQAIKDKFELERLDDQLRSLGQDTGSFLEHTRALGRHLYRNSNRFPAPTPNLLSIVTCRQDGTKLHLPEQSGDIIVTCPTCKYRFAYNTTSVSFYEPPPARLRPTLADRIRNLIRQKRNG